MYTIDQKKQSYFCFMAQAHFLKTYFKTKNILWVRDFEDRMLCPRTLATYAFFSITLFSDIREVKITAACNFISGRKSA